MKLPHRINARWIDSLTDEQLQEAEGELHRRFTRHDAAERAHRGEHYDLLRGPDVLTEAWLRWSMACNAARERGLHPSYRR